MSWLRSVSFVNTEKADLSKGRRVDQKGHLVFLSKQEMYEIINQNKYKGHIITITFISLGTWDFSNIYKLRIIINEFIN